MESSNQKFQVQIETGAIMEAELITVVEIDGKEYAVYSIDNKNNTVDILASYVEKDEEGYDKLVNITDPKDKEKISMFIKKIVS